MSEQRKYNLLPYTTHNELFDYHRISRIEHDPEWENDEGNYVHAVYGMFAPTLSAGEMRKSISPNNRKIILVGTRYGNVVMFQRYSNGVNNKWNIVMPNLVRLFIAIPDDMSYADDIMFERIIGFSIRSQVEFDNIGKVIEEYHSKLD